MASTSTMFSSLPSNVNERRMELFNRGLDAKLSIPGSESEKLWPFLDNMYVHYCKNAAKTRTTSSYRCRLWRDDPIPVKVTPENRKRIRASKALVACPCKIKVITKGGEALITRVDRDPTGHNHQLEAIEYKLPTGVRDLAANEVGKGYTPHQILSNLKSTRNGNLEALKLAGDGGLSTKDIHNAGAQGRNLKRRTTTP